LNRLLGPIWFVATLWQDCFPAVPWSHAYFIDSKECGYIPLVKPKCGKYFHELIICKCVKILLVLVANLVCM